MKQYLSESLLQEMSSGNSCMDLPENKAFALFTIASKKYIVVASGSNGAIGTLWVDAYECISSLRFFGKTQTYNQHRELVEQGKKEREYTNVCFSFKGEDYVIINRKITFHPVKAQSQLTIF